jgi:transposase-like protein
MADSSTVAEPPVVQDSGIKCPSCGSEAVYRYGKAKTGRQRFLCLICGMQFTNGSKVSAVKGKPVCSQCGRTMHLYKIEGDVIRFRCSGYPECKTYRKFRLKEE